MNEKENSKAMSKEILEQIEKEAKERYPNPNAARQEAYTAGRLKSLEEHNKEFELQCKLKEEYMGKYAKSIEREKELENVIEPLLMLCEENGKPVDGFRFRELILKLKTLTTPNTSKINDYGK